MSKFLCQKLKLSIEKLADPMGDEQVKIILEDSLKMIRVEICHAINNTSPQSRRYHVKEAIVIGLRQLIDQAVSQGMIELTVSNSRGVSATLNIPDALTFPTPESPTGSTTELDV
jgi:hypothetical protein